MKKSTLIALFLAGLALLAGCVHPNDLDAIAPAAHSHAAAHSRA
ncbi:MAG TPA: hypothetical protein VES00_07255 [Burkholderiaceae bacterium]|nr:hypothetical protein [Burkholderiaceae bacterium]